MYRLSLIISEIYNKYLPLAEKDGIILNLDFSDTTKEITDPERVKQFLDEHLDATLKRSDKGEVTIGVDNSAITITDSATTLSRAACALLSNRYIDVTSHVGFGTTVKIFFKPREVVTQPAAERPKVTIEGVAADINLENSQQPTLQTEAKVVARQGKKQSRVAAKLKLTGRKKAKTKSTKKVTTKPKAKLSTARTQRQLTAAAKKADKEVKRIAKKASKQAKRTAKQSNKKTTTKKAVTKTLAKSPRKKTVKRKLELS